MNEKSPNQFKKRLTVEHKILASNAIYSFLTVYSLFFSSLITSFLMARIVSQNIWGYLILSLSYVTIFRLILSFLPPSLGLSLNYYIPRYRISNKNNKLKSFLKYTILIRIVLGLFIFIISLLVFSLFTQLFKINLKDYYYLFYMLAPLMILEDLFMIFNDIFRGFNRFRIVFILQIIRQITNIGGLIFILLYIDSYEIEMIAFTLLASLTIPFIINCFTLTWLIKGIKKTQEVPISFIKMLKKIFKYGSHLSVKGFIDKFTKESYIQAIGIFENSTIVTGYSIAYNYSYFSFEAVLSLGKPLTISYSGLYLKNDIEQISKISNILIKYYLFLILFLAGLQWILTDFFLFIVYGPHYLVYSPIVKLLSISLIFNIQAVFFYSLIRASNKMKYIIPISLGEFFIKIPVFLLFLINFGIIVAIIALVIIHFFIYLAYLLFSYRIFKMNFNVRKCMFQYLSFFITLGLLFILEPFVFYELNLNLFKVLNITRFHYFQILSFLFFIFTFLILNIVFKTFSHEDLEYLESFFDKEKIFHKSARKGIKIMKKLLRV